MKKLLKSVLLLGLLLCYQSCVDCKDSYEPQAPTVEPTEKVEVKVTVTTGVATNVSSTSAEVSGNVESLENVDSEVEIGVVYGTDTIPSIYFGRFVSSHRKVEGTYTVTLSDLKPSTTYYYRSCVIVDGKGYYGEVKTFITASTETPTEEKVVVTTGAATNITNVTATISGSVEKLGYKGTDVHIGVLYTSSDTIPNLLLNNAVFKSSNRNIDGEFSVSLMWLNSAVTYYYRICVIIEDEVYYGEVSSFTTKDEITPGQEVDLGLSVKWAGWNVGATSPEQYGGYYAWGEIEEKSDYSESTYTHYNNGYINIGDNISGTQYDVATVKWGNGWRMPTKEECKELYDNCRFEGYTYGGVVGVKVTGPNGNAIFLPAAGYRYGTSLYNAGNDGYYWSGSLSEGSSYNAWYLFVDGYGNRSMYGSSRLSGRSVRPVR